MVTAIVVFVLCILYGIVIKFDRVTHWTNAYVFLWVH